MGSNIDPATARSAGPVPTPLLHPLYPTFQSGLLIFTAGATVMLTWRALLSVALLIIGAISLAEVAIQAAPESESLSTTACVAAARPLWPGTPARNSCNWKIMRFNNLQEWPQWNHMPMHEEGLGEKTIKSYILTLSISESITFSVTFTSILSC
jgi:hypothetical protein